MNPELKDERTWLGKMIGLLKKAKGIFLVMAIIWLVSFGAGFVAGKLKGVDMKRIQSSPLFLFNRNLEYNVPGYGDLLNRYKDWHNAQLRKVIFKKNANRLGLLFFFNNFLIANFTMFIRALFVVPLVFYPFSRFYQGVVLAQVSASRGPLLLLTEFGGYFLVIVATLCLVFWTLFFGWFRFASRREAFVSGLKLLAILWLVSGIFIAVGAFTEAHSIISRLGGFSIGMRF
jgi:hypothetical protein